MTWWRDGKKFRDLPFYVGGALSGLASARFVLRGDGDFRVLVNTPWQDADGEKHDRYQLFEWTEAGLVHPLDLGDVGSMVSVHGAYVMAEKRLDENNKEIRVFDADGRQLLFWQGVVPNFLYVFRLARLTDGAFLMEISVTNPTQLRYLYCVDAAGERWHFSYSGDSHSFFPDEQGGFFEVFDQQSTSSYGPALISHYDGQRRLITEKSLQGGNVVKGIASIRWDGASGRYILYGKSMANSRKVYQVFRLDADADLNLLSLDVRDLNAAYGDYGATLCVPPSGNAWVFTCPLDDALRQTALPALIPFDALPQGADPGLKLQ